MSEEASIPATAGAFARILPAAAASLLLCFVAVPFVLPALGFTETPELVDSALYSVCAVLLTAALLAGLRLRQLASQSRRMRVALDNMSQGLCMFDADERLVVCNRRYREMYGLSDQTVRPGITLTELLQARIAAGSFSRNADEYRRELLTQFAEGKPTSLEVATADGRAILVVNRPMPGGGWVATHDDITDRRKAERERIGMQQQQAQREAVERAIRGFRQRVEELLRTVADGAMAMRSTAGVLLEARAAPRNARKARSLLPTKHRPTSRQPRRLPTNSPAPSARSDASSI